MVVRVGVINNFITRGRVTMTDIVRDSGSKVRVGAIAQCLEWNVEWEIMISRLLKCQGRRRRNSYIDLMNELMPIRHASKGPRFQYTRGGKLRAQLATLLRT